MIDHRKTERLRSHKLEMTISTPSGVTVEINSEIGSISSASYVKRLTITRSIITNGSMSVTLAPPHPSDKLIMNAIKDAGGFPHELSWKSVITRGTRFDVVLNGEYRGTYLASAIRKQASTDGKTYTIQCITIQEWIGRQVIFFDFGAEIWDKKDKAKASEIFTQFYSDGLKDASISGNSPQDGIKVTLHSFLFDVLKTGGHKFSDGKTIEDTIEVTTSTKSYVGKNLIMLSSLQPSADIGIWQQIMKYQSAPYHELWTTTGEREISMSDEEGPVTLKGRKEHVIFRPTPFDDREALATADVPDPSDAILAGGEKFIELHSVESNIMHIIGDNHVMGINLETSDDFAFSYYTMSLSGYGSMNASATGILVNPIIDKRQLRLVGKKVFTSYIDSVDMSDAVVGTGKYDNMIEAWKNLQFKSYLWFRNNSDFSKGSVSIPWLPLIYEGEHITIEMDRNKEDSGTYYITEYTLTVNAEAGSVGYELQVQRGYNRKRKPPIKAVEKATITPRPKQVRIVLKSQMDNPNRPAEIPAEEL